MRLYNGLYLFSEVKNIDEHLEDMMASRAHQNMFFLSEVSV